MQRLVLGLCLVCLGCGRVDLNSESAKLSNNRGLEAFNKGECDKAIADFTEALRLDPTSAIAYGNRAEAWRKKGEYDKAVADNDEALRLNPNDVKAYNDRGLAWNSKGEYDKAIADFTEALRLNPKYAKAYNNRGFAWNSKGEYDKAIADYNQAIKLKPKSALAYSNLAWLQATCTNGKYRDGKMAVESATKARQFSSDTDWDCVSTLAAAYAESGDFEKANELEAKAIEMVADEKLKQASRSRMELYKQGKPYREELKKP